MSTQKLKNERFQNPRLEAEYLLSHTLNLKRIDLYLSYDRPMSDDEIRRFRNLLKRRLSHEPLQYIIGFTEFMSLPFKVKRDIFIPRPETEILVEGVIEKLRWVKDRAVKILDVGTGSGNIAISLAYYLKNSFVIGMDISCEVLETALKNAELNQVSGRVKFVAGDINLPPFTDSVQYDAVVSNPPYVPENTVAQLPREIREYEPEYSLKSGKKGLDFFKKISILFKKLLRKGGYIFFEIGGDTQRDTVQKMLEKNGFSEIDHLKDYNNQTRVVYGKNM